MGALADASQSSPAGGRGIGREHALLFCQRRVAKVVINDLGGAWRAPGRSHALSRSSTRSGHRWRGIANGDNVADWEAVAD